MTLFKKWLAFIRHKAKQNNDLITANNMLDLLGV